MIHKFSLSGVRRLPQQVLWAIPVRGKGIEECDGLIYLFKA